MVNDLLLSLFLGQSMSIYETPLFLIVSSCANVLLSPCKSNSLGCLVQRNRETCSPISFAPTLQDHQAAMKNNKRRMTLENWIFVLRKLDLVSFLNCAVPFLFPFFEHLRHANRMPRLRKNILRRRKKREQNSDCRHMLFRFLCCSPMCQRSN